MRMLAPFIVARLVSIGLLIGALGRHPYRYYTLTRFVVCLVAVYGALRASTVGEQTWLWLFAVLALLFNPFLPIHLDRSTWAMLDGAAALVFFASFTNRRLAAVKVG